MSSSAGLRPAILIISDTASVNPESDKTGPALTEIFASAQHSTTWASPIVKIVSDDFGQIQNAVKEWADDQSDYINLIVTSGGTGFAVRDGTPEVSISR
jgi:gephyrin